MSNLSSKTRNDEVASDRNATPKHHTHRWVQWTSSRLFVQTSPETFSQEELSDFLSTARVFAETVEGQFAVVTDLSALEARSVNAVMRKLYAEHLQAVAPSNEAHCAMAAIVVRTPLQRGLLTAVLWLAPPVYPHVVVTELNDAIAHCEVALAAI